jgi:uncharacterized protein
MNARPSIDSLPEGAYAPNPATTVRRMSERGHYDRLLVHSILDEALTCHVGFVVPMADGAGAERVRPFVIPTIHARRGETLYVHGSPASRMLRTLATGVDVCVTVTLIDALVLARSTFHSSLNYRSVVVLGRAVAVKDLDEKRVALDALVDHVAAGRSGEARPGSEAELRSTLVLALPLEEVSAKMRTGPPADDEADLALPVWAGLIPLRTLAGPAVADPALGPIEPSAVITEWGRPQAG